MNKLLSVNTNKWAKNNSSQRSSTKYSSSESIGILFSIDDRGKHDIVKSLIKRFEADGKSVEVLAFLPDKKENHEFLFDFFTKKDISFWGKYRSGHVTKFINNSFDYLLHIDFEDNEVINGILAQSKAKCRVGGVSTTQSKHYELTITPHVNDFQRLTDEMYNYISLLN